MEDKIAIIKTSMTLRTIPKETLKNILEDQMTLIITDLLSLKDDSARKLFQSLPAIEKKCWSMGINEVVKMFTMYADGELSIQPRSNYFDRVLVGQIHEAYKQQKPIKKLPIAKKEISQEEKESIINQGLLFCFDNWVKNDEIINGQIWVHDHLLELKLFDFTASEKKAMWSLALKISEEKSKSLDYKEAKDVMKSLESKNSPIRINEYKRLRLSRFFSKINAKGKHIKDYL